MKRNHQFSRKYSFHMRNFLLNSEASILSCISRVLFSFGRLVRLREFRVPLAGKDNIQFTTFEVHSATPTAVVGQLCA